MPGINPLVSPMVFGAKRIHRSFRTHRQGTGHGHRASLPFPSTHSTVWRPPPWPTFSVLLIVVLLWETTPPRLSDHGVLVKFLSCSAGWSGPSSCPLRFTPPGQGGPVLIDPRAGAVTTELPATFLLPWRETLSDSEAPRREAEKREDRTDSWCILWVQD